MSILPKGPFVKQAVFRYKWSTSITDRSPAARNMSIEEENYVASFACSSYFKRVDTNWSVRILSAYQREGLAGPEANLVVKTYLIA